MKSANIHEAKTHLSRIVKEVAGGEEYVIGKAGKPVAKIVPYSTAAPRRTPGALKGKIWISPDFDEEIPEMTDAFGGGRLEPE